MTPRPIRLTATGPRTLADLQRLDDDEDEWLAHRAREDRLDDYTPANALPACTDPPTSCEPDARELPPPTGGQDAP